MVMTKTSARLPQHLLAQLLLLLLFLLLLALGGCGSSHGLPGADAGDTSVPDAGDPMMPDAEVVGPPDASLDAETIPPTQCRGEQTSSAGEPCFCQGPFVVDRGFAYRASYDLEVHDVSEGIIVDYGRVTQTRPASEGAVAIARGHLFVGGFGLEVFHLRDPAEPRSVANLEFEASVTDLVIVGDTLLLSVEEADSEGALLLFDISEPSTPRRLARLPLEARPGSVLRYGDDRVVTLESRRFGEDGPDVAAIIDVTEPSAPRLERRIELSGDAVLRRRGAIDGDTLFVVATEPLLQLIDLASGRVTGSVTSPDELGGAPVSILVDDGLAFIGAGQIHVVDVRDVSAPRWTSVIPTEQDVYYLQMFRNLLLTSGGGALRSIALDCR